MKKISRLLILFILLFSVGMTSAYAASTRTLHKYKKNNSELLNAGLITYDWYEATEGHELCANSTQNACRPNSKYFDLYYVQDSSGYYIVYTINPNKEINDGQRMNEYDYLNIIDFSDYSLTNQEKERRLNLVKTLLLFGYNPSPNNNFTPELIVENDPHNYLKMIAMQVLVNEILEGGRTGFDTIEPQWDNPMSFYNQIIFQNGGYEPSKTNTLYYYYKSYVEAARKADQANPSTAFDKSSYALSWDNASKKYKATIDGLGEYKNCTSNNNDVQTYVSGSSVLIVSSKNINNVEITCKYYRGVGPSNQNKDEYFKYYNADAFNTEEYAQFIYGSGWKIFKKSFTVSTEKTNIKIKKVDASSRNVDGAKFTLTLINNQSYSINAVGNGSSVELNKSGNYVISEKAPNGYSGISDFNIKINAKTHKVDSCDKEKKDSNGNVISCLNNQVSISYSNNNIELTIINVPKSFKLMNIDSEMKYISGSSFDIKDKKGIITSIYTSNSSSTPLPALEPGEYNIVQTKAPYPYRLPKAEKDRTTKIKVDSNRSLFVYNDNNKTYSAASDGIIRITNYSTLFNIHTVGHSNPLEGVQFELYDSKKTVKIKCDMESIGNYYYVDDQDSVDNYVYVTNSSGNITFNSLPEGKYYLKQINTVPPYVLPTGNGIYTEIEIKIDSKGISINRSYVNNTIVISNTPNSFNFYKRDTEGNVLTTGKYKLQKYDKKANKFVDLKLKEVENDGTYNKDTVIYKVDNKNGKIQFTLTKGMATFIDMESSSTYRIIETVAPEGYTKASTKDTAIVDIDEFGNASGLLVLIDQKIVKEDDSAYAELIVNIQTGKQRIMYAAIITLVVGMIAGLIFYNKKK